MPSPGAWSSQVVVDVIGAVGGSSDDMVTAARAHRLLATIASAWSVEGNHIDDRLRARVAACRDRSERYRALEDRLEQQVGGVRVLKGRHVAATYPRMWVRESNDLDLCVTGLDRVVEIGRTLTAGEWSLTSLTVFMEAGELNLALDVQHGDDLVQVQGFAFPGVGSHLPPRSRLRELEALTDGERALAEVAVSVARRGRVLGRDVLDAFLVSQVEPVVAAHDAVRALGIDSAWAAVWMAAATVFPGRTPPVTTRSGLTALAPETGRRDDAVAAFQRGRAVKGRPDPHSPRSGAFSVRVRQGFLEFHGPFGSGRLEI